MVDDSIQEGPHTDIVMQGHACNDGLRNAIRGLQESPHGQDIFNQATIGVCSFGPSRVLAQSSQAFDQSKRHGLFLTRPRNPQGHLFAVQRSQFVQMKKGLPLHRLNGRKTFLSLPLEKLFFEVCVLEYGCLVIDDKGSQVHRLSEINHLHRIGAFVRQGSVHRIGDVNIIVQQHIGMQVLHALHAIENAVGNAKGRRIG